MELNSSLENRVFYRVWALLYLAIIFFLTLFVDEMSLPVFGFLLIMAMPFYFDLERFLELCIIVSSLSYYFIGSDEAIMSIYTIYAFLCILRFLFTGKCRKFNNILPRLAMMIVIIISYRRSSMSTLMGMMELQYIIVISFIVSFCAQVRDDKPLSFLPVLASLTLLFFTLLVFAHPVSDGTRITISEDVNSNGFGFSAALMTCIVLSSLFVNRKQSNRILFIVFALLGLILVLISGSRNAFLAVAASVMLFYILNSKREKKGHSIIRLAGLVLIVGVAAYFVASVVGLDMSRFSVESVVESQGSNRINIWTEMIPFIIAGYLWWGYGPGKAGSTETLTTLVHREYNSTHNTLVESFAESGLVGLIVFVVILVKTYINYHKIIKLNNQWGVLYCLFVFLLFAGIGEAYFNDIVLWILIGLSSSIKNIKRVC